MNILAWTILSQSQHSAKCFCLLFQQELIFLPLMQSYEKVGCIGIYSFGLPCCFLLLDTLAVVRVRVPVLLNVTFTFFFQFEWKISLRSSPLDLIAREENRHLPIKIAKLGKEDSDLSLPCFTKAISIASCTRDVLHATWWDISISFRSSQSSHLTLPMTRTSPGKDRDGRNRQNVNMVSCMMGPPGNNLQQPASCIDFCLLIETKKRRRMIPSAHGFRWPKSKTLSFS